MRTTLRRDDERRNFDRTFDETAEEQLRKTVVGMAWSIRLRRGRETSRHPREPASDGAVNVLRLQPKEGQRISRRNAGRSR